MSKKEGLAFLWQKTFEVQPFFPRSRVRHVFREANFCADAMAKRGVSQADDFVVFDFPPFEDVNSFVNSDMYGLYTLRTWNRNLLQYLNIFHLTNFIC